ncbi:hypothetical protein Cfla_2526 [Cellulomonas flavigena DSM 20109]|uniref:Uncharacterized protein n=1 Tax=Cellulomonas flavigena (strain ATCC 482 / DSM 20109 / BCRC 11376 / JCM 18109 / NBRC 3775 / NCIMB 8073 / NRS 134) TaxID=446466 RepID=D5UI69_CELFN|nr:hypothetical protein [Cellulomonas flavigena]ADG75414.1 hypothetical protein Cfla_2526 [Cellulomonas flavigena DSM 20109]
MTGALERIVRWADAQWIHVPRWVVARVPGLQGIAGDGHVVVTVPLLAAVLPGLALLSGLVIGLGRLGYDDVYTESVVLLAAMVGVGFLSGQLGALTAVAFCVGDLVSADRYAGSVTSSSFWFSGPLGTGPLAEVAHGLLPRLVTYLLLLAGVVVLPRAARVVVATIGRGRRIPPLVAWPVVSGLLAVVAWLGTDAWVAAAPTLVRPLFTWSSNGGQPTVQAVATLQETGGVVVAAAVIGTVVRQLWLGAAMLPGPVQDRLLAAEAGGPEAPVPGPARADTDVRVRRSALGSWAGRRMVAAVATSALATLTMAGILEQLWLWLAAFALLLWIRLVRTSPRPPGWLEAWRRVVAVAPAWARLIVMWLVSRVVVEGVSNDVIGSYTGLGVFVLGSLLVVFLVFPGDPQPREDAPHGAVPAGGVR